jgi:RNA polymerase sigma factor (sigma-70 family)
MIDVGTLFTTHAVDIQAYLRRRLPDADVHLAEDMAATVFERALRAADTYEDRGRPQASWLSRIARNLLIDHMRGRRPTEALHEAVRVGLDAGADHHDTALDVRAAVLRLKPTQRAVVTERFLHGRGIAETAALTGSTEDGVKKMQARALAQLKRIWETNVHIQTVERAGGPGDGPGPNDPHITLPAITEAVQWGVATDALLLALEAEEREALAAYEAAKARAQQARRAAATMRKIREAISLDGGPMRRTPAALRAPTPERKPPATNASGRWARAYDRCQRCSRTEIKHAGRGLCFTCYSKAAKSLKEAAP